MDWAINVTGLIITRLRITFYSYIWRVTSFILYCIVSQVGLVVGKKPDPWTTHPVADRALEVAGGCWIRLVQIPFRLQLLDTSYFEHFYCWLAWVMPISCVQCECFQFTIRSWRPSARDWYRPPIIAISWLVDVYYAEIMVTGVSQQPDLISVTHFLWSFEVTASCLPLFKETLENVWVGLRHIVTVGLSWTVYALEKVTAVLVRWNGNFQTPISVPAVRPKRCHTLSNPAHRQDYTVDCLNYTLQTMMPLSGWPVMAPNAYDNNNNSSVPTADRYA